MISIERAPSAAMQMRRSLVLVSLVTVVAAATAGVQPARAAAPTIGFKWLGTTCVPAAGGTVRAQVRVRMIVTNSDTPRNWAQGMRVSARLVPLSAGVNFTRSWRTQRVDDLVQNNRYSYDFTVLTDSVKRTGEWGLNTKLVWDRVFPIRDIVKEYKSPVALPCIGRVEAVG